MLDRRAGPRVLVVGHAPGVSGAVARELESAQCLVVHVTERTDAAFAAQSQRPEVIVLEGESGDPDALGICRALAEDSQLGGAAIILASHAAPTPRQRVAVHKSRIWNVFAIPAELAAVSHCVRLYAEECRASVKTSRASLIDEETGLYNVVGLARRCKEINAEGSRQRRQLAFVVMRAECNLGVGSAIVNGGHALTRAARLSDVVGRLGPTDFLVLAPSTNAQGAAHLARRLGTELRATLRRGLPPDAHVRVRVGFTAFANLAYAPVDPTEMLARASHALQQDSPSKDFDWISPGELDRPPIKS